MRMQQRKHPLLSSEVVEGKGYESSGMLVPTLHFEGDLGSEHVGMVEQETQMISESVFSEGLPRGHGGQK